MNVLIPTAFRKHTGGASKVSVNAANVGEALRGVVAEHADLKSFLYDDTDQLVSFVNVFVNDKNIRDLENEDTVLATSDEILLVPAIAGG